ncbi:MAG TPA: succinate dehydrogenase assembly factor 2 [Phenylobacterium sp.]|uniref:FAD assembly factor SdhE n=1 Tax=Phenylobacterium conjunctum TaxID=1298959 RepID=A0ABW3SWM6_9CAUL|nr:succinate dehydrogenase assembly factor 2 [Phenylobacterium sp.]HQN50072.1 succinate dehydrogenase assembly factor 2 [Phenylobacterium sp.]HQP19469.1 succinate dehydrogenase assembly factor 2 [Phenylobacterium sp.]
MTQDDIRLKRLKYRAWHRGFREADLILGPFADRYAETFTAEQLDSLEALLEHPDQDLYEWIVERTPTPPEVDGEMMRLIKQFRFDAFESRGGPHGG